MVFSQFFPMKIIVKKNQNYLQLPVKPLKLTSVGKNNLSLGLSAFVVAEMKRTAKG